MRLGLLLLLLVALVFGSGYWYSAFDGVCDLPVRYRIGNIDERFGTDREEIKRVALRAESIWEDELMRDLFIYDENGDLPIHLVFDERQENAVIEEELREDLAAKEGMSEAFAQQYDALIAEFRKLRKSYESRVVSYEKKLNMYNQTVNEWNSRGGAPEDVIEELRDTQSELTAEQTRLEANAKELNRLVSQLNAIGARANTLITSYNTVVEQYNDRVAETGEFTQGDYTGTAISVYQFNTEDELAIVLAHEFGHAISVDHVPNERSIMYHMMRSQRIEDGVSEEDIAAFNQICAPKSPLKSLISAIRDAW